MKSKINQFRMKAMFNKLCDLNVLNGKEMKYNVIEVC